MNGNPWKMLSSREVYRSAWLSMREDSVIRPDGSEGTYSVLVLPPSSGVVAIDAQGNIALVRQWRYVHNRLALEIPTGGSEAGETPQEAAARELKEETGLTATQWENLGLIENSNGATTDVATIFLATGLTEGLKSTQADEATSLVWMPLRRVVAMVESGEIRESTSVVGILKAARKLGI